MLELKKYLNDDVINIIKSFVIFQPQTRKELGLALYLITKNKEQSNKNHGPIYLWDVSKITNMSNLLSYKFNFNENINDWDVSNVTNMTGMFYECHNFNQPLNKWNTENVISMNKMFYGCKKFNQPLNKWKLSKVENTERMFYDCNKKSQKSQSFFLKKYLNFIFKDNLIFKYIYICRLYLLEDVC